MESEVITLSDLSCSEKALILTYRNGDINVKMRILSLLDDAEAENQSPQTFPNDNIDK